jgi:hypothetical protein
MSNYLYYNGNTYAGYGAALTWQAANAAAQATGVWQLAVITSAAENQAITNYVLALGATPTANDGGGASYVWLGASDIAVEGTWTWVDGTAVASYTNWGSGTLGREPDNYGGVQDAMALGLTRWPQPSGGIGSAGQWNDLNPADQLYSLFEIKNGLLGSSASETITGSAVTDNFNGGSGNDILEGAGGIDTSYYTGIRSNFSVTSTSGTFIVKDNVGSNGTDTLTNIERLLFADTKVALDLDGNAGTTAKILGAVFGAASVANKQYVGIGLSCIDAGWTYENLMAVALDAAGAKTHEAVVNLLWTNLVGSAPTAAQAAPYVTLLDNGTYSAGALGVICAESDLNTTHINLVGLQQTGIEYS